jgi:hypothetical protein
VRTSLYPRLSGNQMYLSRQLNGREQNLQAEQLFGTPKDETRGSAGVTVCWQAEGVRACA